MHDMSPHQPPLGGWTAEALAAQTGMSLEEVRARAEFLTATGDLARVESATDVRYHSPHPPGAPWPDARRTLHAAIRRALIDELGAPLTAANRAATRALDMFERVQWPELYQ